MPVGQQMREPYRYNSRVSHGCLDACTCGLLQIPHQYIYIRQDSDHWWGDYCRYCRAEHNRDVLAYTYDHTLDSYSIGIFCTTKDTSTHAALLYPGKGVTVYHDPYPGVANYNKCKAKVVLQYGQ